ncbi:MAG: AglZ/HisF2 family acetamidino modification protein [Bacillota bacterium]
MLKSRVIPCLLLKNRGLVKTVKFKDPRYIGDPINCVKIFNDKEVDELVFLDIQATMGKRKPQFDIISDIASECFMPLCYGGGINTLEDIQKILNIGVEKIAINSHAIEKPEFVRDASRAFGSQSIVVSIDVKKSLFGKYQVYSDSGIKSTRLTPIEHAMRMEEMGAGEILLNSIDKDGTMAGYDLELIKMVSESVHIPVIACGGAGDISHFKEAIDFGKASAVAAGSLFVFQGSLRAVLINYPEYKVLENLLNG